MNWNHYLLEEKNPNHPYVDLGQLEGTVQGIYDLSQVPQKTKVLSLKMPLKKYKLTYSHYESIYENPNIEAAYLNEVNEEIMNLLKTLPNLKYLHIACLKQESIIDLSSLSHLEVLILSTITKLNNIDFLSGLKNLKTLYIRDFKNLYDLSPLSKLTSLQELHLSSGGMSGVGKPIKSVEPLSSLKELQYLFFVLAIENNDISSIFSLNKLKYLKLLPRYYQKDQLKLLQEKLANTIIE